MSRTLVRLLVPVIAAGGVLTLWLTLKAGVGDGDEAPALLPSGERLRPLRPEGVSPDVLPPGSIDLLERLIPSSDAVCGAWGFQERSLVTAAVPWSRLQLPWIPPEEYDLRLTATRKQGTDALIVGFVLGGRQGTLEVDGQGSEATWIDLSDAYDLGSNESLAPGKRLKWNRPTRILISVRARGVTVQVDGTKIIEWKGDAADLKLPPGFRVPNRRCLFIGSQESMFRLDEFLLTPVTGNAARTR